MTADAAVSVTAAVIVAAVSVTADAAVSVTAIAVCCFHGVAPGAVATAVERRCVKPVMNEYVHTSLEDSSQGVVISEIKLGAEEFIINSKENSPC